MQRRKRKKIIPRVNRRPFRDLSVIVVAVSLVEVMALDPKIKRHIHDLKYFPGAPDMKNVEFGGVKGGGDGGSSSSSSSSVPICFSSLALLLFSPMAMVLVPNSPSLAGKQAAIVPLHHNVAQALTALCRFDQRNKIADSSAVTPHMVKYLEQTKSRTLQESMLRSEHSVVTEIPNLQEADQVLYTSAEMEVTLAKLSDGEFQKYARQIKELIEIKVS
jgi:hypothetical protein